MKKIYVAIIVIIVVLAGVFYFTGQERNETSVVVGMSGGYPPYTYVSDDGELTGFDVDVWKEIGQRINKEITFETADFSGLFGLLDSNKITTIANQITVTDERLKKYDFSESYVYYGAQIVVHQDDNEIVDLESLKGKKVGVSLGSNYETMIREYDTAGEIEVITYESYQGSLQDVSLSRIDAVLNDKLAGLIAIETSGLDLKLGGEPVERLYNAFPFSKETDKNLIAAINQALIEMKEDGTLTRISLEYFPVDISSQ